MSDGQEGASACFVCKKLGIAFATCAICQAAGRPVVLCSPRCRRVHERDGRHRKEKRVQAGK